MLSTFVFVLLRGHVGRRLEIAAEIGGIGETQRKGHFFDRNTGILIHHSFGSCGDVVLNPSERRCTIIVVTEDFGEITRVVAQDLGIVVNITFLPMMLHHEVAELEVDMSRTVFFPLLIMFATACCSSRRTACCTM